MLESTKQAETVGVGKPKQRGEPWALGSVMGYVSAEILDRVAVAHADPLVGPFLRGLPSLSMGIVLVWKNRTLAQLRRGSSQYIGRRAIGSLLLAGILSTSGLFAYYFAMRIGGVVITVPVLQTYAIWGTLIAWFFLGERIHPLALTGVALLCLGLAVLAWGQLRGQAISPQWFWAVPLTLFTALTYGVSGVLWRDSQLRGAHQSVAILLQFIASESLALIGIVVLITRARLFDVGLQFAAKNLAELLSSGVLSGILAIYCLFTALRLMAVARVFAFSSLNPILAALFAHFFLHEYLSLSMLSGVLLVSIGIALTQVFRPKDEKQA